MNGMESWVTGFKNSDPRGDFRIWSHHNDRWLLLVFIQFKEYYLWSLNAKIFLRMWFRSSGSVQLWQVLYWLSTWRDLLLSGLETGNYSKLTEFSPTSSHSRKIKGKTPFSEKKRKENKKKSIGPARLNFWATWLGGTRFGLTQTPSLPSYMTMYVHAT